MTLAELGESPDACRWAGALRERLVAIATRELPALPAIAPDGAAPTPPPEPPPPPVPVASPPQPTPSEPAQRPTETAHPSRLGGAILLAVAAALAIVLGVVLLTRDDDEPTSAAPPVTSTTPSTQPSGEQPAGNVLAQVNLLATPAGGQAVGIGLVQRAAGQLALAIEAQRLPANGAQDIYAVWIDGAPGARLLGFVPRQVRANGTFTVSAALPRNARGYSAVLVTRESTAAGDVPTQPSEAIMRGVLELS